MPYSLIRPLALVFTLAMAPALHATTIQDFTFDELVDNAEFIFQGRVTDVRSFEAADGLVYTWVRFDVDEVVKGASRGAQVELRFLGGETADRKVAVSDMHIPEEGETGIYFVDSLDVDLVNPLLGWSQGHFLIESDEEGGLVITDAEGRDPAALVEAPDPLDSKVGGLQQGRRSLESKLSPSGTTPAAFKQAIRDSLGSGAQ